MPRIPLFQIYPCVKYSKKIKKSIKPTISFFQNHQKAFFYVPNLGEIYSKQQDNIFENLEPYTNIALYPKELQTILHQRKSFEEIFSCVYSLKTPDDPFSYLKKIDKLKLLGLGQEKIVNNFLKGKFTKNMNQKRFEEFLDYTNQKKKLSEHINSLLLKRKTLLKNQSNSLRDAGNLKIYDGCNKMKLSQINLKMLFKNVQ